MPSPPTTVSQAAEEPGEAGELTESELTGDASGLGTLEGGGPVCSVEAEAVSLEACVFRSDSISPRESQVSVEEEAVGGSCSRKERARAGGDIPHTISSGLELPTSASRVGRIQVKGSQGCA